MLRKRILVCLDISDGRVVSDAPQTGAHPVGDPVALARRYQSDGADEICFVDVADTVDSRRALLETVQRTAEQLAIPLMVYGSVNEVADIGLALRAGADKVAINTAAVQRPELLREASQRFGSQCIIAGIDVRVERRQIEIAARPDAAAAPSVPLPGSDWFRVFTHRGSTATELDAVLWAQQCAQLGAGEILITSIDQGGGRAGYDLELIARIVEAVQVPVIASGGAGSAEHMRDAFLLAGAHATMAAGIFHDGVTTVAAVKRLLAEAGVPVRSAISRSEQPRENPLRP